MRNGSTDTQVPSLKSQVEAFDQQLNELFLTESIQSLMAKRSDFFDNLLSQLWQDFGLHQYPIALNAVGGFGRGALHPKSDIDITILYDGKLSIEAEIQLSDFLTRLWDLGVDIGQSVRSIKETITFAQSDITIATNLFDIRVICGCQSFAANVLSKIGKEGIWTMKDFYDAKLEEQETRHKRARNTALYLEPNIKNNPGGMRDLHTIDWLAQKHNQTPLDQQQSLAQYLSAEEIFELSEAYDYICRVRWALHVTAKRAEEKLLFDHQGEVAQFMGFGGQNNQLAIENMMRQLFRAMTRVREFNQIIIDSLTFTLGFHSRPVASIEIDEYFSIKNGLISVNFDQAFIDKRQVMRLFYLLADHQQAQGIAPGTLRLLRQNRRRLLGELIDYQGCREEFIRLITHKNGLKLAFSLMHRYGALASYSAHWRWIEGKMQFDMHNAYTVDEHAFRVVQALDGFWDIGNETLLVNQVCKRVRDRTGLILAALLHHISGQQSIDKNELSAIQAKEFASQHTEKKSTIDLVYWLVANQDLLVSAIQTVDIADPNVIKDLAKQVGNEDKLNALYCFTVADMMATNEEYWNDWQEALLNKLYLEVRKALKSGIENIFETRVLLRENKSTAKQQLLAQGVEEVDVIALWSRLPNHFFSANTASSIALISHQLLRNIEQNIQVFFVQDTAENYTQLIVYTNDRNNLFADIFNVLSAAKLSVKDAQIMKSKDGNVLEIIKLLDADNQPIVEPMRLQRLKKRVTEVIVDGSKAKLAASPRYVRNFDSDPEIDLLESTRKNKVLLKINTLDKPIYMQSICSAFSALDLTIHSAKITTLGESTENVFLLSNRDEEPMTTKEKHHIKGAINASLMALPS